MGLTTDRPLYDLLDYAPVGILIFDENFIVKFVNESFFAFQVTNAAGKKDLLNKDILRHNPFTKAKLSDQLLKLNEGADFEIELYSVQAANGSELTILAKGTSYFAEDEFKGGILILEDIKLSRSARSKDDLIDKETEILMAALSDKFYLTDKYGEIKYSSVFNKLSLENNVTRIEELFSSASLKGIKNLFDTLNKVQKNVEADLPVQVNSEDYIVKVNLLPYKVENGELSLVAVLIKDVTAKLEERINFESELNELRRYQAITSSIVDAVIGLNLDGEIKFWNESSEKVFGISRSAVYGKFINRIFPTLTDEYFEILKNELMKNRSWEGELSRKNEDEEEFYHVRMGIAGDEEHSSIVMLCSSITEQTKFEKELRQSEERFRNIVTNTHEYICTIDLEGNISYVNPFFVEHFGYSAEELLSFNIRDIIEPHFLNENKFKIEPKNLSSIEAVELPLLKKDGSRIYVIASFASVEDLNGKTKYYIAVLTDITEKKQAEKDLLLIRTVFEASQDGIAVTVNKRIVLVNNSFVEMTGCNTEEEIIDKELTEFINDDDIPRVQGILNKLDNDEEKIDRFDFDLVKRDGSKISIENSVAKYKIENRVYIVSVLRDITKEKIQREKLVESEERYRSITENINESLWTAEKTGEGLKAVLYTQAIKNITGYTGGEFLQNKLLWFRIIHPSDVEETITKFKQLYRDPARSAASFEYRIINKNGNTVWIENKLSIVRDEFGGIDRIYGLVSDISLNKRAEEELKNTANELKSLNEAKDRFLSIISHDLRTPFSSILGFTDFLLTEEDISEAKKRQYIEMIQSSSKNMLSLVNSLLDWTRLQTGRMSFEPQRINARKVIDKAIDILSGAAMKKNINLFSMLEGDVYVHADDDMLLQVFNNLISNSIKFTNEGGDISVNVFPKLEQRAVEFSVNDNGVGIKKEDQEKLFNVESKHTTPGTSGERGSGLGLSLVHDIVKRHGGDIRVESEYGKGTRIYFSIPISSSSVLLVDDSKKDRLLYSKIINSFLPKHEIIEASDGKEALQIITDSPPALVITDHNMKEMSGYEMAKQLKLSDLKFKPPVIVLSSDVNESVVEEYAEIGVDYVFKKPVNLNSLKQAIDNSLKKAIYNNN